MWPEVYSPGSGHIGSVCSGARNVRSGVPIMGIILQELVPESQTCPAAELLFVL